MRINLQQKKNPGIHLENLKFLKFTNVESTLSMKLDEKW